MEAIMEIANDKGIAVVEDLAQATGSTYYFSNGNSAKAGTIGTIGCTSFFPSKNLGCYGDGGALFTNDDRLAEEIRSIANHGMKIRYHHDTIGVNSRLDTIQAAILSVKLKHLDEYNVARQEAAMLYDSLFRDCKSLIIPQRVSWSDHIFHQYTLRLVNIDRKRLIEKLSEKGIPAMVYYPIPLHKQKALEPYVNEKMVKEYPNSIMLSESVLSLPMHTELTQEVQHYIADNVLSLL
jgi:dTDP-4-amino-4,6-dideoxygalactose transaminase